MNGKDVKKVVQSKELKLWQVAYEIGIDDSRFSKILRREIPEAIEVKIMQAIDKLTKGVQK